MVAEETGIGVIVDESDGLVIAVTIGADAGRELTSTTAGVIGRKVLFDSTLTIAREACTCAAALLVTESAPCI